MVFDPLLEQSEKKNDVQKFLVINDMTKMDDILDRYPSASDDKERHGGTKMDEEYWRKKSTKKSATLNAYGLYQRAPCSPFMAFDPVKQKKKITSSRKEKKGGRRESIQLNAFRRQVWGTIASYEDDPHVIMAEVKAQFSQLSADEKDRLETQKGGSKNLYCICQAPYKETDPTMVTCDLCGSWYHYTCIGLTEHYVIDVPRYHCQACLDSGLRSFANFLLHYDLSFDDHNLNLVGNVHQTWKTFAART